uniref:hypothetical protein n=1 Tax=Cyclobacterium marinum TaxID=104 RepID=UPI0002E5A0AC|nr:hypothetical protein [Cyclobacterium marinum]
MIAYFINTYKDNNKKQRISNPSSNQTLFITGRANKFFFVLLTLYFLQRCYRVPKGFTRIRHYGILASAFKATHKVNIDSQIGQVVIEVGEKPASLFRKCSYCKTGESILWHALIKEPPANWFNKIRKQNKKHRLA